MIDSYATKFIIYNAFSELLKEKPLKNIKIQDILDRSQISRSTFYRHFTDKFDLMNWFYKYHVEQMYINGNDLYEIHLNIIQFYYNNRNYFLKILNYEGQNSFRYFINYKGTQLIEDFVKRKLNTNNLSDDLLYAIKMFNYGCCSMVIEWLDGKIKMTVEEFTNKRFNSMPQLLKGVLNEQQRCIKLQKLKSKRKTKDPPGVFYYAAGEVKTGALFRTLDTSIFKELNKEKCNIFHQNHTLSTL